jgi:hypothetical protein
MRWADSSKVSATFQAPTHVTVPAGSSRIPATPFDHHSLE